MRCRGCGTLVEVPFFPRQGGGRRKRQRRWRAVASLAGALGVVLLVPFFSWQWWQGSIRADQAQALAGTLAELDRQEQAGDPAAAFLAAEAALAIAERSGIEPPGGLDHLRTRRDDLSRAEAAARLDALPSRPTDQAFVEAQAVSDRVESDPALANLRGRAVEALAEAARQWVDERLGRARQDEQAGRPAEALAIAEQLAREFDSTAAPPLTAQRSRVRQFAAELVEDHGIRIDSIELTPAEPGLAPEAGEVERIGLVIREGLLRRGYLVATPGSPLADLWSDAPFRFRTTLVEQAGRTYLQSPNRTTLIRTTLALDRDGQPLWSDYFEARTRIPLPGLSALEASRMEIGNQASPETERRFARDARADLIEKITTKLTSVPRAEPS